MAHTLWLFFSVLLCFGVCHTLPRSPLTELHCSHNSVMEGRVESSFEDGSALNVSGSIQFHMSLHETACVKLEVNQSLPGHLGSSSILHSVEFLRLEHHYSIAGKYKFAVPSVTFECKCDCAGGDRICAQKEYQYKNCTSSASMCYRTYHPFQSNVGCLTSAPAEACCETHLHPFNDWTFQAIKIRQPATMLVLRYRIFERLARGWRKSVDRVVEVPLNSGIAKFELNTEHNIEIIAGGSKPNRQLEPGLYFWRIGETAGGERAVLRGGVPLNDVGEASLDKLGWFRWEQGAWGVRNGLVKLTQAQHVEVLNCKAQTYRANLNAEFHVFGNGGDKELNLGTPVQTDPWVGHVEIGARSVKIDHAEGTNLLLTLKALAQPRAVYHLSQFAGFNGTIQLDKESNRFLNLTFESPRGTLVGQVFASDTRTDMDLVFSVQTTDGGAEEFRAIVALPDSIDARRFVCMHASGDLDSQQCQWLEFHADPLGEFRVAHRWQQTRSDCVGCNERGVDAFLTSLDPRQWLDGLNSPTEIITCVFEAVLMLVMLLVIIAVCTKCIIPLCRWLVCITKVPKKG